LNLASPPRILSRVCSIAFPEISPSCFKNLFLFPGFRITTCGYPFGSTPNTFAKSDSADASNQLK